MAYINNNGQTRVGVRIGNITNSPITQPTISASLLQSIYGVWNGEISTTLGTSLSNVWNGELVGTTQSNSLDSGVYLHLNGVTQSSTIDDSIYAVWKADGNATDSVGSNNGTIMGGLTYSAGKIGSAFQFNGTNAYVRLADNSMNFTGDFTISAWVYMTSGGPQAILSNEYYNGTTMKGWGIYIDNAGSGQTNRLLQFAVYRNTMSDYTIYQASLNDLNVVYAGLSNNAWSHISIVRKSGVDTIIYVNGEKVNTTLVGASASRTLDPLYNTTQYVTIGADSWNSTGTQFGNYMKSGSKIDGLSVWNRALDSFEITQMYNNGVGYQYPFPNFLNTSDLIGDKKGAMINGASHSTGYTIPSALSLDGVNDYYQFPDNIIDSVKTEFSISFWMKTSATSGWIFGEQTTVNNNTVTNEIDRGISLLYSGGAVFTFRSGNNGSDFNLVSNLSSRYAVGKFSMAEWNHVTLTYKQNVGVKFYFNGVLINSSTTANPLSIRTSRNIFRIGSAIIYYNGSTQKGTFFSGQIDSFTIRNREVSQSEVSLMYNGYNPISYPYSNKTVYGIYDSFSSINGTYSNVSGAGIKLVDGKLNKSFWFDGASSIALPENSLNTLVSGDFSISFWVYATNGSGAGVSPFTYTSVNGTTINGFEMRLSGWIPQFVMYNNNTNANSVILTSSTNIVQNTWNHVVITRKRGTRSKLYLNGVLVASNTSTADPVISGTFIGVIGHNKMTGFNYVLSAGSMMDGITTWSKELMDDEVTQLYNAGNGVQAPFTGDLPSTSNQLGMDNGTLMNGCTFGEGKIGKAFQFDGVNDYVQLPNNSLNLTTFSISAWVNPSNTVGSRTILNSANYVSALDYGWKFRIIDGQLSLQIYSTGGLINEYKGGSISTNTWTHVSATRINGSTKLYINGSLVGAQTSGSINNNPNFTTTTYCSIGSLTSAVSPISFFIGSIDSLSVWQKELTQSEITELYNSGNGKQITATPIVKSGLVLNLDASRTSSYTGTGTTWTDISGSGNSGTFIGNPTYNNSDSTFTFSNNNYIKSTTGGVTGNTTRTVSIWFKINGLASNDSNWSVTDQIPFSLGSTTGGNLSFAINISYYAGGNTIMKVYGYFTQYDEEITISGDNLGNNQWRNITVTWNGLNPGTLGIYIDGVFKTSLLRSSGEVYNTSSGYIVGTWADYNRYYTNKLGSVLVYNRVLTSNEILQNYNATKSRFGY